jgi:hypothetical protein
MGSLRALARAEYVGVRGFALCSFAAISLALSYSSTAFSADGKHNEKQDDCPPGTTGRFTTCRQYWEAINKEALRQGYADKNRDRVADFLQNYTINHHDCADVAAETHCVAERSQCIQQKSKQLVGSGHSDNEVEGIGECDFTPFSGRGGSSSNRNSTFAVRGGIKSRAYGYRYPPAPDPGETVDPAYTCAMNGADTGDVAGGGGGMSDMAALAMLQNLLNGRNSGSDSESDDTNDDEGSMWTPTPTPTTTAQPTAQATPQPTARPIATPTPARLSGVEDTRLNFKVELF